MKKNNIWKSIPLIVLPLILFAQGENWVYRYNNNGDDEANSIVYGADGNIYAAGSSYGIGTSEDFTVISLTTAGDTNWVYRYNGPGNGPTILSGPLALPKSNTCKVFDITGRVVIPDKIKPGIYFIEVDGVFTQKVVKVR